MAAQMSSQAGLAIIISLGCTICAGPAKSSDALFGVEPFVQAFRHDFQTDALVSFEGYMPGPGTLALDTEQGIVTLPPSWHWVVPVSTCHTTRLTMDITFPPLTEDGDETESIFGCVLSNQHRRHIRLHRRRVDGSIVSHTEFLDIVEESHSPKGPGSSLDRVTQSTDPNGTPVLSFHFSRAGKDDISPKESSRHILREYTQSGDLPNGEWAFSYHHGLMLITHGGKELWRGYLEGQTNVVTNVTWEQRQGSIACRSVQLETIPHSTHSDKERVSLHEAEQLNMKALGLFQSDEIPEALVHAKQASDLYLSVLGEDHHDAASSFLNLALVLEKDKQCEAAQECCARALRVRRKVLGSTHPDTALVLTHLGGLMIAQKKYELGYKYLSEATPILEKSFGKEHPLTRGTQDIVRRLGNTRSVASAMNERREPYFYLGCKEVNGSGTVVQLDRSGELLGSVQLPGAPYGLAVCKNGLVAAVPSGRPGRILTIYGNGKVETLLQDKRTIPHPIAIAADPDSGDILVADNQTDVLLLLPAGQPKNASKVFQIKGHEDHLQSMSVAFTKDNHLLFGGSGLNGIYRFPAGKNAGLGLPVLSYRGGVSADPTSNRWVVALRNELRVFEEDREILKLPFPAGKEIWYDALAFRSDGTLVMALHRGQTNYDVVLVDLEAQTFRPLFSWNKARIVSLAVTPETYPRPRADFHFNGNADNEGSITREVSSGGSSPPTLLDALKQHLNANSVDLTVQGLLGFLSRTTVDPKQVVEPEHRDQIKIGARVRDHLYDRMRPVGRLRLSAALMLLQEEFSETTRDALVRVYERERGWGKDAYFRYALSNYLEELIQQLPYDDHRISGSFTSSLYSRPEFEDVLASGELKRSQCGIVDFDVPQAEPSGTECSMDLGLENEDGITRYLVPKNGARIALSDEVFPDVSRDALLKSVGMLSRAKIDISRLPSVPIHEGSVLLVQTSAGNLTKVRIDRLGQDLQLSYVTYKGSPELAPGSLKVLRTIPSPCSPGGMTVNTDTLLVGDSWTRDGKRQIFEIAKDSGNKIRELEILDTTKDMAFLQDGELAISSFYSSKIGSPTNSKISVYHSQTANRGRRFASPAEYPYGLAFDGARLWVSCIRLKRIFVVDVNTGAVSNQFDSPDSLQITALDWDLSNQVLWAASFGTADLIHALRFENGRLTILRDFRAPASNCHALTVDGKTLWIGSMKEDQLYQVAMPLLPTTSFKTVSE